MQFTEQQISAVARVLSDRAAEDCGVDKDDNWKTYSENYLNDAHVALGAIAAAPQVVADETMRQKNEQFAAKEWLDKTEWVQQNIDSFPLQSLGKHRADVMREEIERLRAALAAAPVQAQEPVLFFKQKCSAIWIETDSIAWLEKATPELKDTFENRILYRAPVQPVAVPDGWRDAALESAVQAVVNRAGESESIALINAFDAIRSLKKNRSALPESCSSSAAPAAQGDADAKRLQFLIDNMAFVCQQGEVWSVQNGFGSELAYREEGARQAIDAAIAAGSNGQTTAQGDSLSVLLDNMLSIEVGPFNVSIVAMATEAEQEEDQRGEILATEPWHKNGPSLKKATAKAIERAIAAKAAS